MELVGDKPWFAAFAGFCGVNVLTMAAFKLQASTGSQCSVQCRSWLYLTKHSVCAGETMHWEVLRPLEARLCWCADLYRNHEGAPWFTTIESIIILDTQAKDRMSVKPSSRFMSKTNLESHFLKHNLIGFSDTCNQEVMIEIVSYTCVHVYMLCIHTYMYTFCPY